MTTTVIGIIECPDCHFKEVPFKESSKRLWATYTCPECGSQHFARSDKSNVLMRKRATLIDGQENKPDDPPVIDPDEIAEQEIIEQEIIEQADDDEDKDNGGTYWG